MCKPILTGFADDDKKAHISLNSIFILGRSFWQKKGQKKNKKWNMMNDKA